MTAEVRLHLQTERSVSIREAVARFHAVSLQLQPELRRAEGF